MASQALKEEPGIDIPGEGEGQAGETGAAGERDFEAEAREHGWTPESEFKGDPKRFIDAETFMKRADEMMPLLKADKARLKRELDAIRKDLKRANTHYAGAEERAYKRALSDIEAKIEAAVETGDVAAAKTAMKEMADLSPEDATAPKHTKEEAQEALDDFREEHPWYDRANLSSASEIDINGRLFFDRMVDKHIDKTKDMAPADFFAFVTDLTLDKYPQLKAKAARQKPTSAVEGASPGPRRGMAKSWDNLPPGAKRQYERFIGRGLLGVKPSGDSEKDTEAARKYYARSHDWEGYSE